MKCLIILILNPIWAILEEIEDMKETILSENGLSVASIQQLAAEIEADGEFSGQNKIIIREENNITENDFENRRYTIVFAGIASSCILVAVSIIGAGICFYKRYGRAHHGSGHIGMLSEDGSIDDELIYVLQQGHMPEKGFGAGPYIRGPKLDYTITDTYGNIKRITKNGIVNPLKSAQLMLHSATIRHDGYERATQSPAQNTLQATNQDPS